MAYFAHVQNGLVLNIIIIDDVDCGGGDFPESEPIGQAFIHSIGLAGKWVQTSPDGNFRGTYAAIGFTYDPDLDEFVAPIPPQIEEPLNE